MHSINRIVTHNYPSLLRSQGTLQRFGHIVCPHQFGRTVLDLEISFLNLVGKKK